MDGGDFAYFASITTGQVSIQGQSSTVAIDLTQGFQNGNDPLHVVETTKPAGCPSLNYGALWWNPVDKALMGGFAGDSSNSNQTYPPSLWKFTIDGQGSGNWSQVSDSTDPTFGDLTRPSSGLTASSNTSAFYLGGIVDFQSSSQTTGLNPNVSIPIRGLIEYDFSNGTWTNHSSEGYSPSGIAAYGEMLYIPSFGTQGLYLMIGGAADGLTNFTTNNTLQGMNVITIYDPATQTWYHQKATGVIPEPRYQFCATGNMATNNNAYDIFVYGGWDGNFGNDEVRFDEVYILTLPAFQWVKVDFPAVKPRYGHRCYTVGNRQMMFVGGVDPSQVNATAAFESKDNVQQGLGVLDMSSLEWMPGLFADEAPYVQNGQISDIYQAKYVLPVVARDGHFLFPLTDFDHSKFPASWSNQALATLMGDVPNNTASAAHSGATSAANQPPVGLITGAAIGGLSAVGLVIIGAWLLLRLKHQTSQAQPGSAYRQGMPISSPVATMSTEGKKLSMPTSPISEEYAPEKAAGGVLGMYPNDQYQAGRQYGRPQRVVELAHPQVAAVELEGCESASNSIGSYSPSDDKGRGHVAGR